MWGLQDADDMCMICFTEPLSPIPSILMDCGHVFHLSCARYRYQIKTYLTLKGLSHEMDLAFENMHG